MACTNIAKPDVTQRPNNLYGAPQGQIGRTFDQVDYGIQGIILHCTDMTISQYVQYLACLTQPVAGACKETNHHYSIGSAGALNQHIDDGNISWTFGNYEAASYPTPPSPTRTVDWPTLQTENGSNVSPDVYTINILIAKSYNQGTTCLTSSGLPADQHEKLLQLLAYLSGTYNIPIDADYINWHDNIATQAHDCNECNCTDIACLISEINAYCDDTDCTNITYTELDCADVSHLLAVPDSCANSSGCLVSIPFDACCFGHLPQTGNIEQFVGIAEDSTTGKLCLVKNTISVTSPITGEGTTDSPLALDLCSFGEFVPDGTIVNVLGIDSEGCLVETVFADAIAGVETPLTVTDSTTINLTASGTAGHELTASVIISPTAGNLIEATTEGLFVSFDCTDLTGLFETGTIINVYGVDAAGECVSEDVSQVVNSVICEALISDETSPPLYLLGRNTNLDCPVFFSPIELVAGGLSVLDTNSVDLTLDGSNVLSANVAINPATDNVLEETVNGLYVPQLVPTALDDCIIVEIVNGQLNVGLNISPSSLNILSCEADGLYVQDLVVLDTDCFDLTYNPTTRELSGVITLAGVVDNVQNVVSCETGQGLYVPRGANLLANGPLIGVGTGNDPLDIDFALMDNEDLCDLGGVIPDGLGTVLEDVIGRDGNGCLRRVLGEDFINTFLLIQDTDCIDLTLASNVLSAEPIISPAIGGISNILSCTSTGLYVPVGAGIAPTATNCIEFQFVNGVLTATIIFDPDSDNQVMCNPNGLYVDRGAGITVENTDCITMDVTDGVITAEPNVSGSILGINNALTCEASGLFVPVGAGVAVADGNCVTLDLTDGVITAEAIISNLSDNQIVCDASGLYVPQGAGLVGEDTNCMDVTVSNGEITVDPIIDPSATNLLACGVNGLIAEFAIADSLCIDLTLTGGVLTADVIVDPAATNLLTCGANGLLVEFSAAIGSVADTDCIALDLTGDVLTATPILAPDQGALTNVLQCIGDGLYVPVGAGLATLDGNCVELTLVNGVLTAEVIIDPDGDNQVSCGVDGLFVPIAAGLQVLDTDCVDLDITPSGVLTSTLDFAPVQGGVGNVATCIPGQGLYVPQGAGLVGLDTNCIQLIVQPNGVITANPIIDPDPTNTIECRANGLYSPDCCPEVLDTVTVDLTLTGTNTISADVIIDPDGTNALVSNPNGLYVPEDFIQGVIDTQCMDVDVTGGVLTVSPIISPLADNRLVCQGDGLYVPPLTAVDSNCIDIDIAGGVITINPILSPTADNALDCLGDGFYVSQGANLQALDTNCIDMDVTNGVVSATPILSGNLDNILTCEADGLYVPEGFITAVADTNCLSPSVTSGVLTIDPIISPLLDNLLVCQGDGLYVPPMAVVDTDCIDLDFDGTTLTAQVIVDPAADNLLVCQGTGLYVPELQAVDTNCIDLDVTGNVLTANPIISATVDNQFQCLGDGMYVEKGAGLEVLDTNCIDLTIAAGVISADPIISQIADNILTCETDGLYVPGDFIQAVIDTNCIDLTVTGNALTADVIIDPAADNILTCQGTGLYVPPVTVVDSNCIDLDITSNVLTANPIISATADNQFQCLADGMYVPQAAGLEVLDSNCIDLTITGGVLTADPIISQIADNVLTCEADGLYVPDDFIQAVNDTSCITLDVTNGVLTATPIISATADNQVDCVGDGFYVPQGAGLEVTDTNCIDLTITAGVLSADPIISTIADNVLTCEADGLYVPADFIQTVADTNCIDLDVTGNVLTANPIVSPLVDNTLVCQGDGLYVPSLIANNTSCIDLDITGGVLTATPVISATADNQVDCIGDGFYVPQAAGLAVTDGQCVDLTITNGVLTAEVIVSQIADNILTCEADGLYVPDDFIQAVSDTNCLSPTVTAGVLTVDPILSAIADNQIQCVADGFYVPAGAGLTVLDTDCIDMDITGGVISATPIISGSIGGIANTLTCEATGLYVPELQIADTDCIDLDYTGNVLTADPILAPTQGGIANSLICIAGQGLYVPAGADLTVVDGSCVDLTLTNGNVLQAEVIVDPAADNLLTCNLGTGLYVPEMVVIPTDCLDVTIVGNVITIDTIIAPAQGGVDNILTCIAGQGLYVPETIFTRNIGVTPAGNNTIDVDTDGDGTVDFTFCEGFDTILSTNDCVDGGVGAEYAVREFSIADKVLTINSAPEHYSVSSTVSDFQTGIAHPSTVADQSILIATATTVVTNPSPCREMHVMLSVYGFAEIINPTAGFYGVEVNALIDGGLWVQGFDRFPRPFPSATVIQDTSVASASAVDVIPPGGTKTYTVETRVVSTTAGFPIGNMQAAGRISVLGTTTN